MSAISRSERKVLRVKGVSWSNEKLNERRLLSLDAHWHATWHPGPVDVRELVATTTKRYLGGPSIHKDPGYCFSFFLLLSLFFYWQWRTINANKSTYRCARKIYRHAQVRKMETEINLSRVTAAFLYFIWRYWRSLKFDR